MPFGTIAIWRLRPCSTAEVPPGVAAWPGRRAQPQKRAAWNGPCPTPIMRWWQPGPDRSPPLRGRPRSSEPRSMRFHGYEPGRPQPCTGRSPRTGCRTRRVSGGACVGDRSVTLVAAGDQTLGCGRTLGATGQPTRDRGAPCGGTGTSSSNVPTAKSSSGRMPPAAKQRGSPKGRATADQPAPFQCGSKSGTLLRPTRRAAACSRAGGRAYESLLTLAGRCVCGRSVTLVAARDRGTCHGVTLDATGQPTRDRGRHVDALVRRCRKCRW